MITHLFMDNNLLYFVNSYLTDCIILRSYLVSGCANYVSPVCVLTNNSKLQLLHYGTVNSSHWRYQQLIFHITVFMAHSDAIKTLTVYNRLRFMVYQTKPPSSG